MPNHKMMKLVSSIARLPQYYCAVSTTQESSKHSRFYRTLIFTDMDEQLDTMKRKQTDGLPSGEKKKT